MEAEIPKRAWAFAWFQIEITPAAVRSWLLLSAQASAGVKVNRCKANMVKETDFSTREKVSTVLGTQLLRKIGGPSLILNELNMNLK